MHTNMEGDTVKTKANGLVSAFLVLLLLASPA